MKGNIKAHLALLATQLFFAINFSAIKYLIHGGFAKPFAINIIRMAITTALLWLLYAFSREKQKVDRADWARLVICAVTGIVVNQLLFIKGLSYTHSIHAALLMLTTPIIIVFVAAWLLKEKVTNNKLIGLLLGVAGAAALILSKEISGVAPNPVLGDMLVIINAISYAFYFILAKPLMQRYTPVMVIRMVFTIGLIMAVPFCWADFRDIEWSNFTQREYLALLSVVVPGTFFTYLFTAYGLKKLGPFIAGSYIYAQPVFAAIIAWLVLSEQLTIVKIIAGLLIALGLYISNRRK